MEFLFSGCERETRSTVATGQGFVGETHSTTSNRISGSPWVIERQ
jgi:hypothetical protein